MPLTNAAALLPQYTNTRARRHTFFCYCTQKHYSDIAVYWLLVQQFKTDRKTTQAQFIKDWFLDGNIPEILQGGGFLSRANIDGTVSAPVSGAVEKFARATTFTSGGLFGALQMKISGATRPPADLFDATLVNLHQGLEDLPIQPKNGYNPDGTYQVRGGTVNSQVQFPIEQQIQILSRNLTLAGFDPDRAGIY